MRAAKEGVAKLVATASSGRTRLTTVSHRAPARLLPVRAALADDAGSAICALGSYGGGLLGGDRVVLEVHARHGSTLTVGTQASTKVYRTKADGRPAHQHLRARVDNGALLVYCPDPLVPFSSASYIGQQVIELEDEASVVAIDWLSAGRVTCGERWDFRSYSSRTEVWLQGNTTGGAGDGGVEGGRALALVEALSLPASSSHQRAAGFDVGGVGRDAAVSVVVSGPRGVEVAARLHEAAAVLAQRRTARGGGVRDAREGTPSVLHDAAREQSLHSDPSSHGASIGSALLGDVLLGVSEVSCSPSANGGPLGFSTTPPARSRSTSSGGERSEAGTARTITVARLVAEHNEDVYRLLHHCLAPLAPSLGVVPYSDRIHATVAAPPPVLGADARSGGRTGEYRTERWRRMPVVELATDGIAISPSAMSISAGEMSISGTQAMRLIHLCDATLPTGGFAHSGGLEAALQLGLLGNAKGARMHDALRQFGVAAVSSTLQQQRPFAHAAYDLVASSLEGSIAFKPSTSSSAMDESKLSRALAELNAQQHALLAPNAPGCRASLQLGASLSRVTKSWLASDGEHPPEAQVMRAAEAVSILRGLHGATALGALAALLSLPQATLTSAIVYMSARDLLSAAVRLGLLGPLAAVPLQQDIVQQIVVDAPAGAAPNGISATSGADPTLLADPTADPISMAAGSAPLLEAAHACHDLLERRIFQT